MTTYEQKIEIDPVRSGVSSGDQLAETVLADAPRVYIASRMHEVADAEATRRSIEAFEYLDGAEQAASAEPGHVIFTDDWMGRDDIAELIAAVQAHDGLSWEWGTPGR